MQGLSLCQYYPQHSPVSSTQQRCNELDKLSSKTCETKLELHVPVLEFAKSSN